MQWIERPEGVHWLLDGDEIVGEAHTASRLSDPSNSESAWVYDQPPYTAYAHRKCVGEFMTLQAAKARVEQRAVALSAGLQL